MGQLDRGSKIFPCDFYATGLTGAVFAAGSMLANFEVDIPSGGALSGFCNVCIRTTLASGATTFEGNRLLYLYAENEKGTSPTTDASFIRFEDNGTYPYYALLEYACGINAGTSYFFYTTTAPATCFNKTAALAAGTTGQEGWIKCRIGNVDRYIALFSS